MATAAKRSGRAMAPAPSRHAELEARLPDVLVDATGARCPLFEALGFSQGTVLRSARALCIVMHLRNGKTADENRLQESTWSSQYHQHKFAGLVHAAPRMRTHTRAGWLRPCVLERPDRAHALPRLPLDSRRLHTWRPSCRTTILSHSHARAVAPGVCWQSLPPREWPCRPSCTTAAPAPSRSALRTTSSCPPLSMR